MAARHPARRHAHTGCDYGRPVLPHGKWVFWDVHDPANAIGIELRNEHYSKLIVEVGNPEDQISQIRQATGQTLG